MTIGVAESLLSSGRRGTKVLAGAGQAPLGTPMLHAHAVGRPMEKLLVLGDDGSAGADVAWRWIDAQRWPGWRVDVLTAHLPPPGPPLPRHEAEPHPWEPPKERIPSPTSEIASVRHLETKSDPRVTLLRSDADLMVIGPRGRGLLKALHLGSTAEYLLHHPPAPMVIARSPQRVERVLLAADGSAHAQQAAETLAGMPWIDGTHVFVLGVEDGFSEIDRGLKHARGTLDGTASEVSECRARGPASWTILREAKEVEADLIVMGTRGIVGVRRLVIGSAASAVARTAPCGVLAVCAEGC